MNKIYGVLALLLLTSVVYAQEDVYKTMAKEACDCIAKKNYDYNTAKKSDVELSLGLCIMEVAQKHNLQLDLENTEAMTELGQKVGMQMAPICPEVFKAFLTGDETEQPADEDDEYFTVAGKIKSVEEKDFIYVNLKEASGREHKFIWLYYFEGSDDFKDDPKKLIGKDAEITYMQLEVFQPKSRVYYSLNILSGLSVK